VFDLGGVLIDWDPRYLYRTLLDSDDEIAAFLDEVGFADWNHEMDAGARTWAEAVEALATRHPHAPCTSTIGRSTWTLRSPSGSAARCSPARTTSATSSAG
jgi:hypothetical protein